MMTSFLSADPSGGGTEQALTALFKLLGWIFTEEGDKAQPFGLHCSGCTEEARTCEA